MIKRSAIIAVAFVFAVAAAGSAFSSETIITQTGAISAIDTKAKSATIKTADGKQTTVTAVDEKTLAGLSVGDAVESKYVVKDGDNISKSITKAKATKKPKTGGY